MRIGKRLAALAMALVLCCGCLAAPAAAVESRGIIDGAGYIVSNAWNFWTGQGGQSGAAFFVNWLKAFLGDGKTPETATEEDWKNAYTQYNQNIQNNYYTTIIDSSGAGRIPLVGWYDCAIEDSWAHEYNNLVLSGNSLSFTGFSTASFPSVRLKVRFTVPSAGVYRLIFPTVTSSHSNDFLVRLGDGNRYFVDISSRNLASFPGFLSSPFMLSPSVDYVSYFYCTSFRVSGNQVFSARASDVAYLLAEQLFPPNNVDFSTDSRVGTFSGNFGYYGDNGEMVFAENISIVNETNNTYYNPVTGDTSTINEWSYDYSDRSYNVTLDTGDTVNVVYGDENIVIRQGDTVYNIYYTVPSTPEPTPPPSPPPSSSLPPTDPPGPTEPVEPGEKPDTSGWGILDFLKGIFDFLWGIVKAIGDTIMNVLKALFLPKEESVTKVQDLMDKKLPFISDLQTFGDDFHGALVNPVARVRSAARFTSVIDVGNKTSGVSYGDAQADVLDVSWYLEYKDTVDDIIEGVAWLAFLWNLYGALPSIIHGGASGVHTTAQILKWKDEHDP